MKDRPALPARNLLQALGLLAIVGLLVNALPTSVSTGYRPGDGTTIPTEQTGFWTVFISAVLVSCTFACLAYYRVENKSPRGHALIQLGFPHWPLVFCLGVASFLAVCRIFIDESNACDGLTLNADIGGVGVLVGIYFPIFLAIVSLVGGHFHKGELGPKEIGIVILANLVYLTFNLLKAFPSYSRLGYVERLVAIMSIDASNIGLSMTFSNKDALAARTYIGLSVAAQGLSFAVMIVAVIWTSAQSSHEIDCCIRQIWWARLDSCNAPDAALWFYLGLRLVMFVQDSYRGFSLAPMVDRLKKEAERKVMDIECEYETLLATVRDDYAAHVPLLLTNVVALIVLILRLKLEDTGKWSDWGQSATLIACMVGFCHWLYVCRRIITCLLDKAEEEVDDEVHEGVLASSLRALGKTVRRVELPIKVIGQTMLKMIQPKPLPAASSEPPSLSDLGDQLRQAAKLGDMTHLQIILQQAPQCYQIIDSMDDEGSTALMLALTEGSQKHLEVADWLLAHGANPIMPSFETARKQRAPLYLAANFNRARILSTMGRRVKKMYRYEDATGRTLLEVAAQCGSIEVLRVLLEQVPVPRDFDLRYDDTNGSEFEAFPCLLTDTLLDRSPDVAVLELLVAKLLTADDVQKINQYGRTLLHEAIERAEDIGWRESRSADVVGVAKLLRRAGMDLGTVDYAARTLMHSAAYAQLSEMIDYLGRHTSVNVKSTDGVGDTPLHLALSGGGDMATMRKLLYLGANVDAVNKRGITPLLWVIVEAELDDPNELGHAPLLLEAGANPNGVAGNKGPPLELAQRRGLSAICDLLREHGATPLSPPTPLQEAAVEGDSVPSGDT
ncbi:hypothetical protein LTR85_009133 [Meristemomyces frigidus]|nr:hypothetical protein LTR85_009133 [Meristemomyces frigidus]